MIPSPSNSPLSTRWPSTDFVEVRWSVASKADLTPVGDDTMC